MEKEAVTFEPGGWSRLWAWRYMIQVVMKHQPALRKGTKQIYSVTEPLINSLIERPLVVTCVLYPVPQTGRVLELGSP